MFQIMKLGHEYKIIKQEDTPDGIKTVEQIIKFQDGPVKEVGINGIQNKDLLDILIDRLEYLQGMDGGRYACDENVDALALLKAVRRTDAVRTKGRTQRGIEGYNKV